MSCILQDQTDHQGCLPTIVFVIINYLSSWSVQSINCNCSKLRVARPFILTNNRVQYNEWKKEEDLDKWADYTINSLFTGIYHVTY